MEQLRYQLSKETKALKEKSREKKPDTLFVNETKCSKETLKPRAAELWVNCKVIGMSVRGF